MPPSPSQPELRPPCPLAYFIHHTCGPPHHTTCLILRPAGTQIARCYHLVHSQHGNVTKALAESGKQPALIHWVCTTSKPKKWPWALGHSVQLLTKNASGCAEAKGPPVRPQPPGRTQPSASAQTPNTPHTTRILTVKIHNKGTRPDLFLNVLQ